MVSRCLVLTKHLGDCLLNCELSNDTFEPKTQQLCLLLASLHDEFGSPRSRENTVHVANNQILLLEGQHVILGLVYAPGKAHPTAVGFQGWHLLHVFERLHGPLLEDMLMQQREKRRVDMKQDTAARQRAFDRRRHDTSTLPAFLPFQRAVLQPSMQRQPLQQHWVAALRALEGVVCVALVDAALAFPSALLSVDMGKRRDLSNRVTVSNEWLWKPAVQSIQSELYPSPAHENRGESASRRALWLWVPRVQPPLGLAALPAHGEDTTALCPALSRLTVVAVFCMGEHREVGFAPMPPSLHKALVDAADRIAASFPVHVALLEERKTEEARPVQFRTVEFSAEQVLSVPIPSGRSKLPPLPLRPQPPPHD